MGLFGKKKGKKEVSQNQNYNQSNFNSSELPSLPSLPPLESETEKSNLPQLPSFPNNDFGKQFSQNSIKDAVSGEKEGDTGLLADDFAEDEDDGQMMQETQDGYERRGFDGKSRRLSRRREGLSSNYRQRRQEPVFIRIDKFEESLKLFEKAKEQIDEIEDLIKHTKDLKEKEEEELSNWEEELQTLKQEIEKIDEDIFSKVE